MNTDKPKAITPTGKTTTEQLSFVMQSLERTRCIEAGTQFIITTIGGDGGNIQLETSYPLEMQLIREILAEHNYRLRVHPCASKSNQEMFGVPDGSPIIEVIKL